ncbi:DegV family protein [bacterium D16-34]|nr:DegV family protein [bacterium D16-34]
MRNGDHRVALRIAIVTDTNSGVMADAAQELGIHVVPMPFVVDGQECYEGVNLESSHFYERQEQGAVIATSQPSIAKLQNLWDKLLQTHDEIVYIPMSSGLSGSCDTARHLASNYDGAVEVADCMRISVTQREAALDALRWAKAGMSAAQIRQRLEADRLEASIYIMVDTMEYLRKGGRISPAAGAIGSLLKIKPVLQIQGDKLDAFSVAKSLKAAKRTMLAALEKDIHERFAGVDKVHLYVAHTNRSEDAHALAQEMKERFVSDDVFVDQLPLSIACHTGAGALGVGCARILS